MTFSNPVILLVDSVRTFAARPETRIRRSRMSSAGLVFYREVCRAIRKLPKETQSYYRVVAREKVVWGSRTCNSCGYVGTLRRCYR